MLNRVFQNTSQCSRGRTPPGTPQLAKPQLVEIKNLKTQTSKVFCEREEVQDIDTNYRDKKTCVIQLHI